MPVPWFLSFWWRVFLPSYLGLLALLLIVGASAGIVALVWVRRVRARLGELERRNESLEARISGLEALVTAKAPERAEFLAPESESPPVEDLRTDLAEAPVGFLSESDGKVTPATPLHRPQARDDSLRQARVRDQQWWAGLEESLGKRWMTWAGAFVLFLSAGFFLKHAFENQWLGPTGRVLLGLGVGIALLVAGDAGLRRNMRPLGQGLVGGGLAILYVSIFAAFSLYQLIPQLPALALLITVTAAGMALAVLHDALPLGFLAVLGGFLTPLMVSTGRDARDGLFCYLLILDLGALGVALFRRWRALDVLTFLGTWLLFTGWFLSYYKPKALQPTMLWITVFFLVFLVGPFVYQIRNRTAATLESFLIGLANAVVAFSFAYVILRTGYPPALGFLALSMTACYVGMALMVKQRVGEDTRSILGFIGLAVAFLTLAAPLHLRVHGITLAWAVEGPVLLYLGYLFRYPPLRVVALGVVALAAIRLFLSHWPLHSAMFTPFLNRAFGSAAAVPLAAAGLALIHHFRKNEATALDYHMMRASALAAGFLAIFVIDGELVEWTGLQAAELGYHLGYASYSPSAAIWGLGALAFLLAGLRVRSKALLYSAMVAVSIASVMSVLSYWAGTGWEYYLFLNPRFAAGLLVGLVAAGLSVAAAGRIEPTYSADPRVSQGLSVASGLFLLLLFSFEAYWCCLENIPDRVTARWTGQMAVTIVWGLYAVTGLALGFTFRMRALRFAALALLALAGVKLVLVDMAQVQQIYRVVSFVALGLLMILASFLYHRLEARLGQASGDAS